MKKLTCRWKWLFLCVIITTLSNTSSYGSPYLGQNTYQPIYSDNTTTLTKKSSKTSDYQFSSTKSDEDASEKKSLMSHLWGEASKDHLYLGMWTHHIDSPIGQDEHTTNNQLIGGSYKGYYGGTFINSHGDRAWTLGLQRTVYEAPVNNFFVEISYRFGVLYGYKKALRLFDKPIFPLLQVMLDVSYKNVGLEFSWAGVIVSVGGFYLF